MYHIFFKVQVKPCQKKKKSTSKTLITSTRENNSVIMDIIYNMYKLEFKFKIHSLYKYALVIINSFTLKIKL